MVRRIGFALAAAFLAAGLLAALALASPAAAVGPRTDSPTLAGNGSQNRGASRGARHDDRDCNRRRRGHHRSAVRRRLHYGNWPGRQAAQPTAHGHQRSRRPVCPSQFATGRVRHADWLRGHHDSARRLRLAWSAGRRERAARTDQDGDSRPDLAGLRLLAWTRSAYQSNSVAASAVSRTGSISGRVTGHGHPLRDICALALPVASGSSRPSFAATTSKRGTYLIHGIRPGRYLVLFRTGQRSCPSKANWIPQFYPFVNSPFGLQGAAQVRVRARKDTGHIDGRLQLGGEIAGTVRTTAGRPVKGICVGFYSPFVFSGSYYVTMAAASGGTGHYALHGLFPGKYQAVHDRLWIQGQLRRTVVAR